MVEEESEFCKLWPDFHKCGVIGAFLFCNAYKTNKCKI